MCDGSHSIVEKNTTKSLMFGCEYILHEFLLSSNAFFLSRVSRFSPLQGCSEKYDLKCRLLFKSKLLARTPKKITFKLSFKHSTVLSCSTISMVVKLTKSLLQSKRPLFSFGSKGKSVKILPSLSPCDKTIKMNIEGTPLFSPSSANNLLLNTLVINALGILPLKLIIFSLLPKNSNNSSLVGDLSSLKAQPLLSSKVSFKLRTSFSSPSLFILLKPSKS